MLVLVTPLISLHACLYLAHLPPKNLAKDMKSDKFIQNNLCLRYGSKKNTTENTRKKQGGNRVDVYIPSNKILSMFQVSEEVMIHFFRDVLVSMLTFLSLPDASV